MGEVGIGQPSTTPLTLCQLYDHTWPLCYCVLTIVSIIWLYESDPRLRLTEPKRPRQRKGAWSVSESRSASNSFSERENQNQLLLLDIWQWWFQAGLSDSHNLDLTFSVLFNLASQSDIIDIAIIIIIDITDIIYHNCHRRHHCQHPPHLRCRTWSDI